jgi:hypothetical protein
MMRDFLIYLSKEDKLMTTLNKKKFYQNNQDKFLQYFDSVNQYQALILAGNFKKIEEIIKANSSFDLEGFMKSIN